MTESLRHRLESAHSRTGNTERTRFLIGFALWLDEVVTSDIEADGFYAKAKRYEYPALFPIRWKSGGSLTSDKWYTTVAVEAVKQAAQKKGHEAHILLTPAGLEVDKIILALD